MKILLPLMLPLAALGLATPVSAQPVNVRAAASTAGLDLVSPAGLRALDLRILHAASQACGTPSSADARGRIKYDQCRDEARATAVAQRSRAVEIARDGNAGVVALGN